MDRIGWGGQLLTFLFMVFEGLIEGVSLGIEMDMEVLIGYVAMLVSKLECSFQVH